MNPLSNFREWLAECCLHQWLTAHFFGETVIGFGSHQGKDHTDPTIPLKWLKWAVENVKNPHILSAEFRRELRAEIARREGTPPAPQPAARPAPVVPPPRAPRLPAADPNAARVWIKSKAIADGYGLKNGQDVAMSRGEAGGWDYITLDKERKTGVIPGPNVKDVVQSLKDETGQRITSENPDEWMPQQPVQAAPQQGANKYILGPDKMPPGSEGDLIDKKFKAMMESKAPSHMMINALAGAGKTTMLIHLAAKYGRPGQNWLYLVFNKKNQVEGQEKFNEAGVTWVEVKTTNSWCGNLLGLRENLDKIPQTDRIASLAQARKGEEDDGSNKRIEKARIFADSATFGEFKKKIGLPRNPAEAKEMAEEYGNDKYERGALQGILNQIQRTYQEEVLKLVGLAKAFAVHPHRQGELEEKINEILRNYDIDVRMDEVREKLQKGYSKSPKTGAFVKSTLRTILGYDIMHYDFTEAIKAATIWMLREALPGATSMTYRKGAQGREIEYELGQFRDFNDDLWYAAAHANELHWPKYDVVLADEVQDFNQARKVVLQKLAEAGAKIVAVGDPNQSIYRFTGADSSAFNSLQDMLGNLSADNDITQTLSRNFRSRPAIINHVNNVSREALKGKQLIAGKKFDDGQDGIVTQGDLHYNDTFDTLSKEWAGGKGKLMETAFISRTNDPLVHAALKLLGQGIPFVILGRDVARELIKHIYTIINFNKGRLTDRSPVQDLEEKLVDHQEAEKERYSTFATKKHYLKELDDTTLALVSAIQQFQPNDDQGAYGRARQGGKSIQEFMVWLKQKLGGLDVQENEEDYRAFKEKMLKEHPVVLTTAHKSKGLEFDRVFILRDDQFPHPMAVKSGRKEDLEQEDNAKYVAYTRAREQLHILKIKGQPGAQE